MIQQLIAFVRHEIKLSKPMPGSPSTAPYIEHLRMLKKMGHAAPELDDPPECPIELKPLWSYTQHFKPGTLSWQEIQAWMQVMHVELYGWQIRVMFTLDLMRG